MVEMLKNGQVNQGAEIQISFIRNPGIAEPETRNPKLFSLTTHD